MSLKKDLNRKTNTEAVSSESTTNTNTGISTLLVNLIKGIMGVPILKLFFNLIIYYYTMGKFDYWIINRDYIAIFKNPHDELLFFYLDLFIIIMNFIFLVKWDMNKGRGSGGILINMIEVFNFTVLILLLCNISPTDLQRTVTVNIIAVVIVLYVLFFGDYLLDVFVNHKNSKNRKSEYPVFKCDFTESFKNKLGKYKVALNVLIFIFWIMVVLMPFSINNKREYSFGVMQYLFENYYKIFLSVLILFAIFFCCLKWVGSLGTTILSILDKIGINPNKNETRKFYRILVVMIPLLLLLVYYGSFNYQKIRMNFSFVENENFIVFHKDEDSLYGANYEIYSINDSQEEKLIVYSLGQAHIKAEKKIKDYNIVNREQMVRKNDLKTLVKKVSENKGETKTIFLNDKNWIMVYEDKEYYYANSYVEQKDKIIINTDDRMCFKKDTPELKHLSLEGKQVEFTNKNIEG